MDKITSVIAKEADGTIQIMFTVPFPMVSKSKQDALEELAKDVDVPGFRKGKAPIEKAKEKISENTLLEKSLGKILPKALAEAIAMHKIKPVVYPKFELISAKDNEPWQIKAVTCELPEIDLGDYRGAIEGAGRTSNLWTPDKGEKNIKKTELTKEAKEQLVIKTLLEAVKVPIPRILIEEEVTARLSNLLARIEKLGLSLENYLASIGKTTQTLREEYQKQSIDAIGLELTLNRIAEVQNIKVDPKEIDEAVKISDSADQTQGKTPEEEKRRIIENILRRRAVVDSLASLI